jgi:hypothetical protein
VRRGAGTVRARVAMRAARGGAGARARACRPRRRHAPALFIRQRRATTSTSTRVAGSRLRRVHGAVAPGRPGWGARDCDRARREGGSARVQRRFPARERVLRKYFASPVGRGGRRGIFCGESRPRRRADAQRHSIGRRTAANCPGGPVGRTECARPRHRLAVHVSARRVRHRVRGCAAAGASIDDQARLSRATRPPGHERRPGGAPLDASRALRSATRGRAASPFLLPHAVTARAARESQRRWTGFAPCGNDSLRTRVPWPDRVCAACARRDQLLSARDVNNRPTLGAIRTMPARLRNVDVHFTSLAAVPRAAGGAVFLRSAVSPVNVSETAVTRRRGMHSDKVQLGAKYYGTEP